MPLYEYKCINCEKVHEVIQKFSDPRLETCPDCQGTLEKLLSQSSFALKGTGWYTTDYKAKKPGPVSSTEKSAAPAVQTGTQSSGEGKAASAPAAPAAPAKPASSPAN